MAENPEPIDEDICENHPKYLSQIKVKNDSNEELGETYPKSMLIQEELELGSKYKAQVKKSARQPLTPKERPIELSFEVCRAKQKSKKRKKRFCQDDLQPKPKKLSMLEKTIMTQEEYMNFLATPATRYQEPVSKPKKVKRCEMSPCPPRFVQLAIPNKRIVLCNWNDYQHSLPVETLLRFQQILHADQNLELRDADYYYKRLERMERKAARKKKRLAQKKLMEKERGKYAWVEDNITATVNAIVNYLREEPLFTLNYKQLLISDEILSILDKKCVITKPPRSTKSTFKKSIIEISDKLAVWMDTVTKFVDVQAVESDEDIPPISISSIGGEEEEEEYEESEEEGMDLGMYGEEEEGYLIDELDKKEDIVAMAEEEYGIGEDDMYGRDKKKKGDTDETDMDLLRHLIQIYEERSPEDYLANEIEKVPGYTYEYILNKMKEITAEDQGPKKSNLEEAMIEWLQDVAPDEVNERTLKAIHEYACALLDLLKKAGLDEDVLDKMFKDRGLDQGEDQAEGYQGDILGDEDKLFPDGLDQAEGLDEGLVDQTGGGEEEEGEDKDHAGSDELTESDIDRMGQDQSEDVGLSDKIIQQEEDWGAGAADERGIKSPEEDLFEGEADIIYEKPRPELMEGDYIRGHKPPKVYEHTPDAICCLSLKIWAVWLLEVIHNAHTWTKWMHEVIRKVREFAKIVRGEVKCADGTRQGLTKAEWRKFIKEQEAKIIAWRQYSAHVKELSDGIIENFRKKKVFCCPKCLQDHLIKNVVTAHETLAALTDAINCAQYWRKCLDGLVQTASSLTSIEQESSEESSETVEIEELSIEDSTSSTDDEGIFELEEVQRKDRSSRSSR